MKTARLLLLRPAPDNALLRAATHRPSRLHRALAAAFWIAVYGGGAGAAMWLAVALRVGGA
ncbi:hypothetical protein G3O06_07575 [Burkholderia sp. Ac-20345]|uniref:hypothetical protein n=1 Tax=Burkholderia sp. Ac-20345 TaxID=2703891 RepID=UPI00197B246D|nr:hypothetical protein [Burkholderia sp. Ac-20345]MBN3777410.1 hypothetical protein [Burkholderia sp. Ac-20345]